MRRFLRSLSDERRKKEEEKNTEKQTLKIGKHVLQHFRLRGDGGSF